MKKFLVYGFGLILCLALGCQKGERIKKTYLLSQQIIDYRPANHLVDTITYTYDDKNRITMIAEPTAQNKGNFLITYDASGRVNTAKKITNSGAPVVEFQFFYTANSQGYYFQSPTHSLDTSVFIFNDQHQLTKIQSQHAGYLTYSYDNRGNITTSHTVGDDGVVQEDITYTYDTQKNPFSQTPSGNYFFMYIADIDISTLINNISFKNGNTYTYTYNSDGYPVKCTIDLGYAQIPVYYNYIVK
jgi:hypothetical protein